MEDESKKLWQSKTVMGNAVVLPLIAAGVSHFGGDLSAETQVSIVTVIGSILNILLRLITKQPVTFTL